MANYVYNRVICNEQAKKQLENKNWCIDEHQKRYFIKYDYMVKQISNNLFELKFDTIGPNYKIDRIIEILIKYPNTKWYCIEENIVEEGYFQILNNSLKLEIRNIETNEQNLIFNDVCFDTYWSWPIYNLMFYDYQENNLIIDDYNKNKKIKLTIKQRDIAIIKKLSQKYLKELNNNCCYLTKNQHFQEEFCFWNKEDFGLLESQVIKNNNFVEKPKIAQEIKNIINQILKNNNIPYEYYIKIGE